MDEWVSALEKIETAVCCILKYRVGEEKRLEYQVVLTFEGDWEDLVFELNTQFGQFKELDELPRDQRKARRIEIANSLENKGKSYDFKLPDGTDEWYTAYCKPINFQLDIECFPEAKLY